MTIAIVGAGIHGLCTARELAGRGHGVTVFEQHRTGNPFGSSHGRSRIVRQAYPDQFYTELLLDGHALWHDLEKEAECKLIHEVGLLFVASATEPEMIHELDALDNLNLPHRVLEPKDIRSVHSHMVLQSGEIAVMTLTAGWADVPRILTSLSDIITARGVELVNKRVTDLQGLLSSFDRVIVTAGGWVSKFVDLPVKVTLQTYAYLNFDSQGPVWIEGFGDHLYGFPSEPGLGTSKIGFHTAGPLTDPDDPDREPQPDALESIKECSVRRFGARRQDLEIIESSACLYSTAANDDFKVGWIDDRLLLASPCSGHGFKFGPWMGKFLANIVEEKEDMSDWPRFNLW